MKHFDEDNHQAALAHAAAGGQALYTHRDAGPVARDRAHLVAAVARGEAIARLYDQDPHRLRATAHRLGLGFVTVEGAGTTRQHVELHAVPLGRALARSKTGR